jgi:hypothetical protein
MKGDLPLAISIVVVAAQLRPANFRGPGFPNICQGRIPRRRDAAATASELFDTNEFSGTAELGGNEQELATMFEG